MHVASLIVIYYSHMEIFIYAHSNIPSGYLFTFKDKNFEFYPSSKIVILEPIATCVRSYVLAIFSSTKI